jgi:alpha-L-fucosidase
MAANGEAIYGTRPWKVFGEGPSGTTGAQFNEGKLAYTSSDIRFTMKDGSLFAFLLGWPETGRVTIRSLAGTSAHSIYLLDGGESLSFKKLDDGIAVSLPSERRGEHAYVLRIQGVV